MGNLKNTLLEVLLGVLPLTVVIVILQFTVVWLPIDMFLRFLIAVLMVGFGLMLFFIGVEIGFLPVGEMIGSALPRLRKPVLIVLLSVIIGIVVTIAEPDLRVLANQVDMVSDGAIPKDVLIYTVSIGVGISVGLAILRIILNIPMVYLLIGGYSLIFILALFTPAEFAPVSFDAGGVTTGPMTVPFILALGVGAAAVLGGKTGSADSFGLVALASVGPVLAVLLLGVLYT